MRPDNYLTTLHYTDLRIAVCRVQVTTLAPLTMTPSCLLYTSLCLCTSCFSSPAISRLKQDLG